MTNLTPGVTIRNEVVHGAATPLISLAAVLIASSAAAAPAPQSPLEAALAKARVSFAAHQPGQPTLDAAVRLPFAPQPQDPRLVEARLAIEAAHDVQLGCAAPCASAADVQVYAGKVELISHRLGITDAQSAAVLENYIPKGKPRLRLGAGSQGPASQALEAEVVARLLTDSRLAPEIRGQLSSKALAMAEALGRTGELKADAEGLVTFPGGRRAHMSAAQLAELNHIPQNQAAILRHLATTAPPSPDTARQKQDKALAEAEVEIKENPGTVGDSYNYWDREAKDPSSNWLWKGYSKLNKGLLTFSGLKAVEESSARLGYVWDNPDVSKGEKSWLGTKLAGNAALTFVTFLPAASVAKGSFYWIGKGSKAVPGLSSATPEAASAMNAAGKPELRTLIGGLNEKTARYGIDIVEGGTTGESVAKGGKIFVSLKAGAQHETVHVVQQVYSRVAALEQMAARTGTTVEALTAAQRAEAFANAAKWETASYAQLESQAFRATGFMGMGGGSQYTRQLLLTGQEVTAGMRNGEVLDGSFTLGQRFYGRLTQWVGHSQAEIRNGVGATTAGLAQAPLFQPAKDMVDGLVQPLVIPPPVPTRAAASPYPLLR